MWSPLCDFKDVIFIEEADAYPFWVLSKRNQDSTPSVADNETLKDAAVVIAEKHYISLHGKNPIPNFGEEDREEEDDRTHVEDVRKKDEMR